MCISRMTRRIRERTHSGGTICSPSTGGIDPLLIGRGTKGGGEGEHDSKYLQTNRAIVTDPSIGDDIIPAG